MAGVLDALKCPAKSARKNLAAPPGDCLTILERAVSWRAEIRTWSFFNDFVRGKLEEIKAAAAEKSGAGSE